MSIDLVEERRLAEEEQVKDRLRWLILRREAQAAALAVTDAEIDRLGRRFADLDGRTMKPTYAQLRRELVAAGEGG
jgi:hypothetical protein